MKKPACFSFINVFLMITGISVVTSCKQIKDYSPGQLFLTKDWQIQSSDSIDKGGELISTGDFIPEKWYKTTVPATVLSVLVDNKVYPDPYFGMNLRSIPGTDYPLFRNFSNLSMSENSPFRVPWWYRTKFQLPAEFRDKSVQLHFRGINFRANIWLNGKLLADSTDIAGCFRVYEFDITDYASFNGNNYLAVEVFAPRKDDLAITWVEWNPAPPDKNMGIWHEVLLTASDPVKIRYPQVVTHFDLPSLEVAHLNVSAELQNYSDKPVSGTLKGKIEKIEFTKEVSLEANEVKVITFTPDEFKQLNIKKPRIWWPAHYGNPDL